MSMYAFFPWYTLDKSTSFAEFVLAPLGDHAQSVELPEGSRDEFCKILGSFHTGGSPIGRATLIRFADLDWNSELDGEHRNSLFVFSELLATAGIAARNLFDFCGYQNRDNFRVVIQACGGTGTGVMVTARRRDGLSSQYWSAGRYTTPKPDHVHLDPNRIDEPLLHALLRLRGDDEQWPSCFEGIANFNLANTDRSDIAAHLETVLTISSFERLLDCRSREDEIAAAVSDALQPATTVPASASQLLTNPRYVGLVKLPALREAWIRDFCRHRGSLAHGRITQGYTPAWSTESHTLLGSYAFPLVLKRVLNRRGLYEWTDCDQEKIDRFEHLLCEDIFAAPENDHTSVPWLRIESESKRRHRLARAVAELHRRTDAKKP